ncbi:unnamed protein product [Parnassius apollo]|uniref:(apollo) hypothetical protein n=1 Tax=Parnassius apollo TaxID=110799 RepID=A0A8S3WCX3_PARAO|nr:unnamed protein product [Parnassius apollo]
MKSKRAVCSCQQRGVADTWQISFGGRQLYDGTGIKFNKDADRINAESKKKVDVLSEELLPYIIAEQERRTTLYKRIMTAIQNGEKGVTIAELRNKPPLIIRKGLLYRCPANRVPKEPDGSGVLMCENDIEPTQVMYDSCLSAEDKDLYVAENKYFFCNRHKVEGPDLPRNGTAVIGCAPMERTSLNYTSNKCTLDDTEDVVVHYRYYPDRTYKFVTELDPDHEVCDHWNPCQIGYIYSLPTPDQALIANELWQDSLEEWVPVTAKNYTSSPRRIGIPDGYVFHGIQHSISHNSGRNAVSPKYYSVQPIGSVIVITMTFPTWSNQHYGTYFCIFSKPGTKREKVVKFLVLSQTSMVITPKVVELLPGQRANTIELPFKCNRCRINSVMVRASDGNVYNVDSSRYRVNESTDSRQVIEVDIEGMKPQDFGDYIIVVQNGDGNDERLIAVTVLMIDIPRLTESFLVGGHFDRTMNYTCDNCEIRDILCNGESVLAAGRISVISVSKMISFNFPRFEDSHSCVYVGFFKVKNRVYKKILAVIDTVIVHGQVKRAPPKEGEQFEEIIPYSCTDCLVTKVYVNGIPVQSSRRSNSGSGSFYIVSSSSITIRIVEYGPTYEGVYQAVFVAGTEQVTKTILEITNSTDQNSSKPEVGGTATVGGASVMSTEIPSDSPANSTDMNPAVETATQSNGVTGAETKEESDGKIFNFTAW